METSDVQHQLTADVMAGDAAMSNQAITDVMNVTNDELAACD